MTAEVEHGHGDETFRDLNPSAMSVIRRTIIVDRFGAADVAGTCRRFITESNSKKARTLSVEESG